MSFDFMALEAITVSMLNEKSQPALTALSEIADLILAEGECTACGALGGHQRNHAGGWSCRECETIFSFQLV